MDTYMHVHEYAIKVKCTILGVEKKIKNQICHRINTKISQTISEYCMSGWK